MMAKHAISGDRLLAELLELDSLDELAALLKMQPAATLRRTLWRLFEARCEYRDAQQWAEAVRICEALTIVGWGKYEQVDAVCEKSGNGWQTAFLNAQREYRYLQGGWTKRKAGFLLWNPEYYASPDRPARPAIDWKSYGRLHAGEFRVVARDALPTQRNCRRLSPLSFGGIHASGQNANVVVQLGMELHDVLTKLLLPDAYGDGLQTFDFCLVTWTDRGKLQSRLKPGKYVAKTQLYRCYLEFEPQFYRRSRAEQMEFLSANLLTAIDDAAGCLKRNSMAFDMAKFRQDVERGLERWKKMKPKPARAR